MKHWIKIDAHLMDDPRIQKLLASNFRVEGLGIYLLIMLYLDNRMTHSIHINQLQIQLCRIVGLNKLNHVLNDFNLFDIDGNGTVSLRAYADAAGDATGDATGGTSASTPEPLGLEEEKRKEIYNKENFNSCENGNHDFDSRWI